MAHLCSLLVITTYTIHPWTKGLVQVQNRNLGTHLRLFLQNPPTNRSFQTQMLLTLTRLLLISNCLYPRVPLPFSLLNLSRDTCKI